MKRVLVSLMSAVVALAIAPILAQETPPTAGDESARYFPAASAIGEDWEQVEESGLDVPSDIFREGSLAIYAGPGGARIAVLAYLATDSRVAVRQSWEAAGETFDRYRYTLADNYDYQQAERLEGLVPPPGCVEAKRAEGTDDFFGFTTGVTLCAIDPDAILLVAASGDVADASGFAASDVVVAAALAANESASTE